MLPIAWIKREAILHENRGKRKICQKERVHMRIDNLMQQGIPILTALTF